MAQETIFLDFDILQLTFNKNGVYHVIPVVSSPIDIIKTVTRPIDDPLGPNWLKIILMLLLAILLIVIFIPLLVPLFPIILTVITSMVKVIWAIITFPFRAIGKAVKSKKQKENKGGKT